MPCEEMRRLFFVRCPKLFSRTGAPSKPKEDFPSGKGLLALSRRDIENSKCRQKVGDTVLKKEPEPARGTGCPWVQTAVGTVHMGATIRWHKRDVKACRSWST